MPQSEFTPKASGQYRRQKPSVSSGKLAIVALAVVLAVLILAILLTPPFWK